MGKPKYEKPLVSDLSSIQAVYGSCISGTIEYSAGGSCVPGGAATGDCLGAGSIVMNPNMCQAGSLAGYSCINGTTAG
jgi:hypothetical protein